MPPIPHAHEIQANNDPELSLSFHCLAKVNNRVDILRRACDVLPVSNLEFLSIYSPTPNESKLEKHLSTLHRSHHGQSLRVRDSRSPAGAHATTTCQYDLDGLWKRRDKRKEET